MLTPAICSCLAIWMAHLVEGELRRRGHDVVAPNLPCDDDSAGLPEYTNRG